MRRAVGAIAVASLLTIGTTVSVQAQDAATEKMLIANERAVNEAVVKGDLATFKKHVSADAWSIDPMGGRASVADFIKGFEAMAKDFKITSWDITETHTIWVDANTAVLTYKWTGTGTYQGQPVPSPVWTSTVWTKKGGKWMAIFHQESVPMPMPAKK
jgi:ketosteroid isomerase-like protein